MTIFLTGSIIMRRHVFDFGRPAYPCCGELGRGDDISFPCPRSIGQGPEGGAGIHGAVSIRGTPIQAGRLGCHGDTPGHRPNVVGATWYPRDGACLLV